MPAPVRLLSAPIVPVRFGTAKGLAIDHTRL